MALAMATGLNVPDGKTFAISGNWGGFEGANAVAFSAVAKVADNVYVPAGAGAGMSENANGARAGVMMTW